MRTKIISVRVDNDLREQFDAECDRQGRTQQYVIDRVLRQFLAMDPIGREKLTAPREVWSTPESGE